MSDRYTEVITGNTLSCAISPGDGTIHDSRKGWGTYSSDGRSITWDNWQPPSPEEIATHNARIEWLKSPEAREYNLETERIIDDLFTRNGTSRAKVAKIISDVIDKAPPLSP